jgi:hypothetical protein
MATTTYYISASYIGQGLQDSNFFLFHTVCGVAANLIEYSGSTVISSASLSDGLVLELDNSISQLFLFPLSQDCPLGCGYDYSLTLTVPVTPTPTPLPTSTPSPTNTPAPTGVPTDTPTPTDTPVPTNTPQPTGEPTNTPAPTSTPTNTPEPTITPEPTSTPTSTPEPTNTPTPTPTNTPLPTSTPSPLCIDYKAINGSNQVVTLSWINCNGTIGGPVQIPGNESTPVQFTFCAFEGSVQATPSGIIDLIEQGLC